MHIVVGSITSLVANDELVFKILFFQSCWGIVKLTDSHYGKVRRCNGDEFWNIGCNLINLLKALGLFIVPWR